MVSDDKLAIFLKLQQLMLDTEDFSTLLNSLLPQILSQLRSVGVSDVFILAAFLDANQQVSKSYFHDTQNLNGVLIPAETVIDLPQLFKNNGVYEKDLLWGKSIMIQKGDPILYSTYPLAAQINSVLISPIQLLHQLSGVVIFGSERQKDQYTPEDIALIEIITNLVALGYKLQDTQESLLHISQEVYKANAQLHDLDKLKDDFVSVASHELRTPMTAIRSYSWMALNRSDIPLSDKMKRYLSRILVSTERLINLVNDMLNISRIESGRVEINPKPFDMVAFTQDILSEVQAKAQEKNQKIQITPVQVPQVFGDPDKIHQVLLNLIGNAMKFTPQDGLITISFFSDGKVVETSVKDSGVGITQEDLPRLFKKFSRLDNSYVAAATSGGTGLGLYICKSLIELMHGTIMATSAGSGQGTTFTFSLPVATPEVLKEAEKYQTKAPGGDAKTLEPVGL